MKLTRFINPPQKTPKQTAKDAKRKAHVQAIGNLRYSAK